MAKKQNQSARTTLEEVNESLTSAAQRIEDNKKYINWALIAIAVLATRTCRRPRRKSVRLISS